MINPMILTTAISVISAGTCTGVTIYKQKKLEETQKNLDEAIDKLSRTVTVDIEDAYIHKIVKTAVDRNVGSKIDAAASSAVAEIKADMSAQIRKEINKSYSDLKAQVKAEMERQIGRIDLDDIRKEIIAEGREEAKEQFKKDLDKIVELQNDNLKNINNIYSNIAETLKGNTNKGTTLTIG